MTTGPVTAAFFGGFNPPGPGYDLEMATNLLTEVCREASIVLPGCRAGGLGELIRTDEGFILTSSPDSMLSENELCTQNFEGVIRIDEAHGYKPLLILLKVQLRLWEGCGFKALSIADSQGNQILFDRFDHIKQIVKDAGFDYEEVRRHAVALGLTTEIVDLARIESTVDTLYF